MTTATSRHTNMDKVYLILAICASFFYSPCTCAPAVLPGRVHALASFPIFLSLDLAAGIPPDGLLSALPSRLFLPLSSGCTVS